MTRASVRLRSAAGALLGAVGVAACGGGGSTPGVGTGSHSNPEGAVRGFAAALEGWDGSRSGLDPVLSWVDPQQRTDFRVQIGPLIGAAVHITVADFAVTGVSMTDAAHAVVHITGHATFCLSEGQGAAALSTCITTGLTPGAAQTVGTVAVGGSWYVEVGRAGALPPSTTTTTSGSDTGTSAASSP